MLKKSLFGIAAGLFFCGPAQATPFILRSVSGDVAGVGEITCIPSGTHYSARINFFFNRPQHKVNPTIRVGGVSRSQGYSPIVNDLPVITSPSYLSRTPAQAMVYMGSRIVPIGNTGEVYIRASKIELASGEYSVTNQQNSNQIRDYCPVRQ